MSTIPTPSHQRAGAWRLLILLLAVYLLAPSTVLAQPTDGWIEIWLTDPVPPASVNIATVQVIQYGRGQIGTVSYNQRQNYIIFDPQWSLDLTAPFEVLLSPDLESKMESWGPLFMYPGNPDCDEPVEFEVDLDEDGLPDCGEVPGSYYWGQPLYHWGARVQQKDIFVELRYMLDGNDETLWMRPWPQALDKVRGVFEDNGYTVHFDVGDLYEDNTYDGHDPMGQDYSGVFNLSGEDHSVPWRSEITWATYYPACATQGDCVTPGDTDGWSVWPANNFLVDYANSMMYGRDRSFYYILFANSASNGTGSGRAYRDGRNAVVTLGQASSFVIENPPADPDGRNLPIDETEQANKIINVQAGTLMHEMGHLFGFYEGGGEQIQGKPNYFSVMSYVYQTTGLPHDDASFISRYENYQHRTFFPTTNCQAAYLSDWSRGPLGDPEQFIIDYSHGNAWPLDEMVLDEPDGVTDAPWGDTGPMDWNCNDTTNQVGLHHNITGKGWYPTQQNQCGQELKMSNDISIDHNDWGNLTLYHRTHFVSGDWPNHGLPFQCPPPG